MKKYTKPIFFIVLGVSFLYFNLIPYIKYELRDFGFRINDFSIFRFLSIALGIMVLIKGLKDFYRAKRNLPLVPNKIFDNSIKAISITLIISALSIIVVFVVLMLWFLSLFN